MVETAALQVPSLSDRVLRAMERIEYRLATDTADRERIFNLRYRAYLREGAPSLRGKQAIWAARSANVPVELKEAKCVLVGRV